MPLLVWRGTARNSVTVAYCHATLSLLLMLLMLIMMLMLGMVFLLCTTALSNASVEASRLELYVGGLFSRPRGEKKKSLVPGDQKDRRLESAIQLKNPGSEFDS